MQIMDSIRDYSCRVCNKSCNSGEQLRLHQSSKAHVSKCRRSYSESEDTRIFYTPAQKTPEPLEYRESCFACMKELPAAEMLSHKCPSSCIYPNGLQLNPIIDLDFINPSIKALPTKEAVKQKCVTESYNCELCHTTLNSKEQYSIHLIGRKHQYRARKLSENEATLTDPHRYGIVDQIGEMYCDTCDAILTPRTWPAHENSKEHMLNTYGESYASTTPKKTKFDIVVAEIVKGPRILGIHEVMCDVCNVPISRNILEVHLRGKSHVWNLVFLEKETSDPKLDVNWVSPYNIQRDFKPYLHLMPPINDFDLSTSLMALSLSDADSLVVVNKEGIVPLGIALCLSLVLANRRPGFDRYGANLPPSQHCYTVWLCNTKKMVNQTSKTLRELLVKTYLPTALINTEKTPNNVCSAGDVKQQPHNLTLDPVRVVTLLRENFSLDDPSRTINQHDVVLSTAGGLTRFLETVPGMVQTICGIIIIGAELGTRNGITEHFIENLIKDPQTKYNRPRLICISDATPHSWSVMHRLQPFQLH